MTDKKIIFNNLGPSKFEQVQLKRKFSKEELSKYRSFLTSIRKAGDFAKIEIAKIIDAKKINEKVIDVAVNIIRSVGLTVASVA